MRALFGSLFCLLISSYGIKTANACLARGTDIIHCGPQKINDLLYAPFNENKCDDEQFLKEARGEYEKLAGNESTISRTILGKVLKGREKDLETLDRMISHGRTPSIVEMAIQECGEVQCALDKIFGSKESAYRALSIARDSGYVLSLEQIAKEDDYIWSIEDLRDISYAINVLPAHMLNQTTMDHFRILPPSYYFPEMGEDIAGVATASYNGEGSISFKNFDRSDKAWPSMVIIHELAHHFDYPGALNGQGMFFEESGFYKINGWESELVWETHHGVDLQVKKWTAGASSCFPRDYAGSSPKEDFAEGIAYYVVEPALLKKNCPKTYSFMKEKVFKGKEYLKTGIKGQVLGIVESDPELMQCIVADYQGLAVYDAETLFEVVTQEGNRTRWKSHGTLKVEVRPACLSKIKAQIDLTNNGQQSCTQKHMSNDIDRDIKTVLISQYGNEYGELLKKTYGPNEFKAAFDRCIELKDVRTDCVTKGMTALIQSKGFVPPHINSFRGELGLERLKGLGFNSTKALVSCIRGRGTALKKYLKKKDNSSSCWWEVTKVFQNKEIKFNENDIIYSFPNAVFDEENVALMSFIKKEFIDRGREALEKECSGEIKQCAQKVLEQRMGLDNASAADLSKAIDEAM